MISLLEHQLSLYPQAGLSFHDTLSNQHPSSSLESKKDFHAFIKIMLSPGDKTTGNFYFSVVYH